MDEQVRSELGDLMKSGGRNLCTMPRMLGILLRQRCPQSGDTVAEVEQALNVGCVRPILDAVGPVDVRELADRLAEQSGMAAERAQWAIETWVLALSAADTPPSVTKDWSTWNRLDVSAETAGGGGAYQRSIGHLILVALAGAFGGTTFGSYCLARGDIALLGPWRDALLEVDSWMRLPALFGLGALGGFAGGLLGWIALGGRSWTYDAHGGTTLGRLVLAALGAFHGAGAGVLMGVVLLGLIGVMVGSLIGALFGAILGLLIAEGISRLLWW